MNSDNQQDIHIESDSHRPASTTGLKVMVGVALAAAIGAWAYESNQLSNVRADLSRTQEQVAQVQNQAQASNTAAAAKVDQETAQLNDDMEKTRQEALASAKRAQTAATKAAKDQAGQVMAKLSETNDNLSHQLDEVKKDNDEKSTQFDAALTGVKGDVGTVRTDLDSTKSELSDASGHLKRVDGDMGVMSGQIATNATELAELRKLGERDYYEFKLPRTGAVQKVGDIQLALKKTDTKRNKFTMDVVADDKRIEKKDKTVNEPVQFFRQGAHQPYEVVVNSVDKNDVVGYLAVPKVNGTAGR